MTADIDLLGSTVSVQMYDEDVVFDDTDEFLSHVSGTKVGAPVDITSKTIDDGQFRGSIATFTPTSGFTVTTLIVYVNTGSDASSRVLAWLDTKADTAPISFETTGDPLNLHWNDPFLSIGG